MKPNKNNIIFMFLVHFSLVNGYVVKKL